MLEKRLEDAYVAILREELVPATGCTEPIAIAYCAALLAGLGEGRTPERILAEVSGNILKNVKSVVVPNTGGMKGLKSAIAIGYAAGNAQAELQVLSAVTDEGRLAARKLLEEVPIAVSCPETSRMLDICLTACFAEGGEATVHIANNHTNVIYMAKDGIVLLEKTISDSAEDSLQDKSVLSVHGIVEFASTVAVERIRPLVKRQVDYNTAIAEAGLAGSWGANIGRVLLAEYGDDIKVEAKAWAAAASDARMSGCDLPVVILSGSGNQGITASVPVARYAGRMGATEEEMLRAVALSDLVTIHQKSGIGRLSAYCGAISAGVGAGAGIAYLLGGDETVINHTIVNAVAILSGTICDGAKPSCAAKIAAAVDAGILGYHMYRQDQQFYRGDGIVGPGVEKTIDNVGVLAREGMRQTDRTILHIMTEE